MEGHCIKCRMTISEQRKNVIKYFIYSAPDPQWLTKTNFRKYFKKYAYGKLINFVNLLSSGTFSNSEKYLKHDQGGRVPNCVKRFLKQFEAKRIEAMEIGNLIDKGSSSVLATI